MIQYRKYLKSAWWKIYILLIPFSKIWHLPWLGYKLQPPEIAFLPLIITSLGEFRNLFKRSFWKPSDIIVFLFPLVQGITSLIPGADNFHPIDLLQTLYLVILYFIFRLIANDLLFTLIPEFFIYSSLIAAVSGILGWVLLTFFSVENPMAFERLYPYQGQVVQAGGFTYSALVLSGFLITGISFQTAKILDKGNRSSFFEWLTLLILFLGAILTFSKTLICLLAGLLVMSDIRFSASVNRNVLIYRIFIWTMVFMLTGIFILGTHFYFARKGDPAVESLVNEGYISHIPVGHVKTGDIEFEIFPTSYFYLKKNALKIFIDSGGWGVGPGGFSDALVNNQKEGNYPGNIPIFPPHSSYFGNLAEKGILGLILVIGLFWIMLKMVLKSLCKKYHVLAMALFSIYTSMIIEATAIDNLNFRHYWILFGITTALYYAEKQNLKTENNVDSIPLVH
jgi:hypothetical protein